MADPNTRQGKRTPVTLKIKFKSETLEQFIERYAVDVSQGGIFIRTKEPLAVGTQMRFEFQLRDASPLIAGEGTVVWTRENDPSRPAIAPGMGVRFDRLAEGSQGVLERILAEKAKQAPQRPATESSKPPMFTDTPTRVAPAPVQEALLGKEANPTGLPKRKRPDSFGETTGDGTPLPRPMPFHSDADEFPEEAFEEATKVRALDELIAQTADATSTTTLRDELADRRPRADATVADPPRAETAPVAGDAKPAVVVDRDSAPGLPSPPEGRMPEAVAADAAKAKLGAEGARVPLRPSSQTSPPVTSPAPARPVAKDAVTKPTGMRAVAAETRPTEPRSKSNVGVLLVLLFFVAAGAAAVWFFVIRPKADETKVVQPDPGSGSPGSAGSAGSVGSAMATNPDTGSAGSAGSDSIGSNNGSGGSAVAMTGSNGSAGSAVAPAVEMVETLISAAGADKATVEVLGTDQTGASPLKAKLEKGKPYRARVQAPGFMMLEMDVKGGDKATAKLIGKPRVISVNSQPPGALIFIDGGTTGHSTPFDVELTKAQAAKKSVRVQIRKSGFRAIERVIDLGKYTEDAAQMIAKLDEKLAVQAVVQNPTNNSTNNTTPKNGSNGTTTGSAGTTT
ncbi:TIGR02266 family protein, partial [Gemmatimonas sp.]|uniref:TIGR02266 family protein n=1 Tax=Gemmatimonas sp. TaxID=1962908 RepID=UPI0039831606